MSEPQSIEAQIAQIRTLIKAKLGHGGKDLAGAVEKARGRLPRQLYKAGMVLARAEPMAGHPKLSQTLDGPGLNRAAEALRIHLEEIDLADRRKGLVLGMLGGMAFNLLVLFGLVIWFLVWRGFL